MTIGAGTSLSAMSRLHTEPEVHMSPLLFSTTTLVVALTLSGAKDLYSVSPPQSGTAESPGWISPNLVLNQDQFSGSWKQFKGELKQNWGEFTDDDLLYIEGRYDKYAGRLQERYGDRKEEIKQWTDEWFKKHHFEQDRQKTP